MMQFLLAFVFLFSTSSVMADGYKPFSEEEKALSVGLGSFAIMLAHAPELPDREALWVKKLPGDGLMTEWLGAKDVQSVRRLKKFSDIGMASLFVTPIVFTGNSQDVGRWQAVQSFAVTGLATQALKLSTVRQRPYASDCRENKFGQDCFSQYRNESFISGHSSFSFTGAGLICAFQDSLICPASVLVAGTVGALRIASYQHHLSDVLAGAVVGWLSGFYLSKWRGPQNTRDRSTTEAIGYQMSFSIP